MGMRIFAAALFALAVSACSQQRAEPDLNPLAETYVRLSLEIGTHEEGYIDAYYGPPEWKTEVEANPRPIAELKTATDQLLTQINEAAEAAQDEAVARRARTLAAYVSSARFRLEMIEGARAPFVEEAERLFALRPEIVPLERYDAVLQRLETSVPGRGALADRIAAFTARYVVPRDRADAVMRAAIDECRRRTAEHITLPEGERFDFEFVSNQPWGAYNWYQGDNHSLIQVNTDLPLKINAAIGYGCHEGYPGHHVQGMSAERLYRENGWVEYSIMPLYSPQGPLNEGGGNYGETLAFPGDERMRFEQETLFPLAGLDPATAPAYYELLEALGELSGAQRTIDQMYLDGEIDRERAIELLARYSVSTRQQAEKHLEFADHYRSYVINYSSGEDVVRAYVERIGDTQGERWAAYEQLLTTPTTARDLAP
jgi:hypothetical protein